MQTRLDFVCGNPRRPNPQMFEKFCEGFASTLSNIRVNSAFLRALSWAHSLDRAQRKRKQALNPLKTSKTEFEPYTETYACQKRTIIFASRPGRMLRFASYIPPGKVRKKVLNRIL